MVLELEGTARTRQVGYCCNAMAANSNVCTFGGRVYNRVGKVLAILQWNKQKLGEMTRTLSTHCISKSIDKILSKQKPSLAELTS